MKCALSSTQARYSALSITVFSALALTMATANGQSLPAPGAKSGTGLGVMLQAGANGLCVDNAGSIKPGTAIQGWKCSARNLNQRFEQVDRVKKLTAFRNKLSGLCLDAGNGTKKPGATIFQAPCSKRKSQALKIFPLSQTADKKNFQLRASHSGLCLQLTGDVKRGERLIQALCAPKNPNQKFNFKR